MGGVIFDPGEQTERLCLGLKEQIELCEMTRINQRAGNCKHYWNQRTSSFWRFAPGH